MKQEKEENKKLHNSNFFEACKNAVNGIIYGTTTQSNVKKQLVIIAFVMLISLFFNLSKVEFICLIFACVLIIFAEMVNTAVETVVDLYVDVYHPKAKIAKDVAAGAVVITAINAVIIAYFLFFDKIGEIGNSIYQTVINSPTYLAFVVVILIVIVAVALKAAKIRGKRNNKELIISCQSMLASAAVVATWIVTENLVALSFATILAIMICMNRVESKERTVVEVVLGVILGILITILMYGLTLFR
ncbi:MAG: diacylglycerol kinase [Clostridia bacterium]|nr:diacylglycerol kinase [Clostridia bacterium]